MKHSHSQLSRLLRRSGHSVDLAPLLLQLYRDRAGNRHGQGVDVAGRESRPQRGKHGLARSGFCEPNA